MALMSYLIKDRNGTSYFRRGIPENLRAFMPEPWTGRTAWKRSLGTKLPAGAKVGASTALRDCTVAFQVAELRRTRSAREELRDAEREAIEEYWRRVGLAEDTELREFGHQEDEDLRQSGLAGLIQRGTLVAGPNDPIAEIPPPPCPVA
jgi:hypothetical protein